VGRLSCFAGEVDSVPSSSLGSAADGPPGRSACYARRGGTPASPAPRGFSDRLLALAAALCLAACATATTSARDAGGSLPRPAIPFAPKTYACVRAETPVVLDGKPDEVAWEAAEWTEAFVDIEGPARPDPSLLTRAKMLWDDTYFYFAARMEEPHLWATYTERDSVIFHEHDFEVFLDPDADTHHYYELEINVLGTEWDLLLARPYRDGGPAIHAWDIPGLRTKVHARGTINDPSDTDEGWSVEIAMPWTALAEAAGVPCPPRPGDRWRVNFSRVEWRLAAVDGEYEKERDADTGKALPESNWVWSPQGLIAMHYPEMWGVVEFREAPGGGPVAVSDEDRARWLLRRVYYDQRDAHRASGAYATSLPVLRDPAVTAPAGWSWPPAVETMEQGFAAWMRAPDGRRLVIRENGRVHWTDL